MPQSGAIGLTRRILMDMNTKLAEMNSRIINMEKILIAQPLRSVVDSEPIEIPDAYRQTYRVIKAHPDSTAQQIAELTCNTRAYESHKIVILIYMGCVCFRKEGRKKLFYVKEGGDSGGAGSV